MKIQHKINMIFNTVVCLLLWHTCLYFVTLFDDWKAMAFSALASMYLVVAILTINWMRTHWSMTSKQFLEKYYK